MRRGIILSLIAFFSACSLIQAADHPLISPLFYDLDLTVDYEKEILSGTCQLTVVNLSGEPARIVPVVLYRLMKVTSVIDGEKKPMEFIQNIRGYEGEPKLQVNYVEVTLAQPLVKNQTLRFTVQYKGYLEGMSEVHGYVHDRIDREFTLIREETGAYPKIEYPSERFSKHTVQKRFDYRLKVNVPGELTVANAGVLVDKISHGDRSTFIYKSSLPSWRMDIAISKYSIIDDGAGIRIFCFDPDYDKAKEMLDAGKKAISILSGWFGELKVFNVLTIIEVPDNYGSQTDLAAIIQEGYAFRDEANWPELYHELSHLWNPAPLDSPSPRLVSEGSAMFLQYLVAEKIAGEKGIVNRAFERYRDSYLQKCKMHPEYGSTPMALYGVKDMVGLSYTKGLLFFNVLYEILGESEFTGILGDFFNDYRQSGATLNEFLSYFRKRGGESLDRFFKEWVNGIESHQYLMKYAAAAEIAAHYRE